MLVRRMLLVGVLMVVGAFGLFKWELATGADPAEARTVAVNLFVMMELFYLFNCRSLTKPFYTLELFSNPLIFAGSAVMIILQLFFTYAPVMNLMFQSAPIGIWSWVRILLTAILVMPAVAMEKHLAFRR
jgi:Ca2+-transporting ATPase